MSYLKADWCCFANVSRRVVRLQQRRSWALPSPLG